MRSRSFDSGHSSLLVARTCETRLTDPKLQRVGGRPRVVGRKCLQEQAIPARVELLPRRVTAGETERIPAGKEVAKPDEHPEVASAAPELEVEAGDGAELPSRNAARSEREHRRGRVGRLERRRRDLDAPEEGLPRPGPDHDPGNAEHAAADRGHAKPTLYGAAAARWEGQPGGHEDLRPPARAERDPSRRGGHDYGSGSRRPDRELERPRREVPQRQDPRPAPAVARRRREGERGGRGRRLRRRSGADVEEAGSLRG